MNCTKCGKEIPDGKEICEDCEKKLKESEKVENTNSKEEKKKNKKTSNKNEDSKSKEKKNNRNSNEKKSSKETSKKDEKKEVKIENKSTKDTEINDKKKGKVVPNDNKSRNLSKKLEYTKNKRTKKKFITNFKAPVKKEEAIAISIIAALVLVLIAILVVFMLSRSSKVGNSIGNIRNYGYAAYSNNNIYYLSPNEDSTKVGIFKVNSSGDDKKEIYMSDEKTDIVSINVYKDYLYFIAVSQTPVSDSDEQDNKICRVKTNGKDLEIINDNEFNNSCYEIYVLDNRVYYIGEDENIYKMKLDGSKRELVLENSTGYLGITNKYIVFNKQKDQTDEYITQLMNRKTGEIKPIIEDKRLYSIDIDGDYVYYSNENKYICRTKIGSNVEEVLLEKTAYNLNYKDGYLYFLNYRDEEKEDYTICIYRIAADGENKEVQEVKELATYSSFINLIDDWVLYLDTNETSAYINLTKVDGSSDKQLYLLKYSDDLPDTSTGSSTVTDATVETTEQPGVEQTPTESAEQQTPVPAEQTTTNTVSGQAQTEKANTTAPAVTTNQAPAQTQTPVAAQ